MEFSVLKRRALSLLAKTLIVKEEVEKEVGDVRFSTCLQCEHRDVNKNICRICTCFLERKCYSKTNWNARRSRNEITHCPLGKWGDVEIANFYREMDGKELLTTN